jgi:autotransporter translocation and assembly factor TamB
MGRIKDFQLQIDHLTQRLDWAVSKIMSQPTDINDLHHRLNDTNKALDAVNARLAGEISLQLKAQSAHTLAHQTRLDVIEEQIDDYYEVEHPEANKSKKPLYADWEYDANGMIIDAIDDADRGC